MPYYLNTKRGFVVYYPDSKTSKYTFNNDARWAYPFPCFEHADEFGKMLQKEGLIEHYAILIPTYK